MDPSRGGVIARAAPSHPHVAHEVLDGTVQLMH